VAAINARYNSINNNSINNKKTEEVEGETMNNPAADLSNEGELAAMMDTHEG
jgi:hypothetical protein